MSDSIQFHSRVGSDGLLNVVVDLGKSEAPRDVIVTVQPLNSLDQSAPEPLKWPEFVNLTYGSCAGLGLERHEQGQYENRDVIID